MDIILEHLQSECARWKVLPLRDKVELLVQVRDRALKASKDLGVIAAKVYLLARATSACHRMFRLALFYEVPAAAWAWCACAVAFRQR